MMHKLNPDRRALRLAFLYGLACHGTFALAGLAMLAGLFYTGMPRGLGTVPWPCAGLANLALLAQFPPDQLLLATAYTAYCVLAPRLKERRFERIHGARFEAYRARVPYWLPRWPGRSKGQPT